MYAVSDNRDIEAIQVSSRTHPVRTGSSLFGLFSGDTMKEIQLTRGKVAMVDGADFDWLNQWKWHVIGGGIYKFYAMRTTYVKGGNGKVDENILMHRLIISVPPHLFTDHINGDSLDNRRCNLRACTRMQNQYNRKCQSKQNGKYKGVHWRKDTQRWRALIRVEGKLINLGHFDSEVEAAKAYNVAAIEYQKEFAWLNEV